MDSTLTDCLKKGAINEQTIGVLEEEMVRTMETFILLKEEHFERLLPRLKVGQHAQLLKLWEEMQDVDLRCSCTHSNSFGHKSSSSRSRSSSPGNQPGSTPPCDKSSRSSPVCQALLSTNNTPDCSGSKELLSSKKDIKELARLYRESALSRFNKGCVKKDSTDNSNNMKILLGRMLYDERKKKGTR